MLNLTIGHASKTEHSGITNGVVGDQTGKEVCMRSYYMHSKGWYALRPKNIDHANAIAEAMVRACKNDNIGYDQSNRLGIITYGTNSSVKTECDCSSLVRQCVIEGTGKDAGNFTTANEKTMLLATGLFEDAISVTSSTVLYNGDILITKTKGHTVIVVSGNERSSSNYTEKGENNSMMKGMDISKYQPTTLDFNGAKKAGYEFVIIRIGYNSTKDKYFESHYTNAKSAGLKVGVYFYTTKLTEADAIADANRVLGWLGNKSLDFPIAYDMEESSMKSSARKDLNSKQFNAFADVIRAKGFVPMLYTGSSMFNNYFNKSLLTDHLWIANYGSNKGNNNGCPNVGMPIAIHQYTSADIPSDFYTAKLDRNQMMISYEELMKKSSKPSTPSTNTTPTTPTTSLSSKEIVKAGQTHANNFAQCGLVCDGIYGVKTKKSSIKVLQRAMNLDYKAGLVEDGIWGAKSEKALGSHYVKRGETQYMVTALEILLMLRGCDPKGVELPGKFGSGLEKAVKQYQKNKGLSQTGVANASTFKSLIS